MIWVFVVCIGFDEIGTEEISEIVEIGSVGLFVDFDMIWIWGVKCILIEILSLPNVHDWMICHVADLCSVMGCFWIVRLCYFCAFCFKCIFPYLNLWFYDAVVGVFLELLKDWLLCCHEMFLTWKRIFYGLAEVYSIYFKYFFQEYLVVLNSGGHVAEWRSFPLSC